MTLLDQKISRLDGTPTTLGAILDGNPALIVNVASKCGLTPQYEKLERLHEEYSPRGFTVLGVPCNQFGGQEPGAAEEIAEFCSTTYGVTFPMTEKVDVNGKGRHPIFEELTLVPVAGGRPGDVTWNFEKFVVDANGQPVARLSPQVEPDDEKVLEAIEYVLQTQDKIDDQVQGGTPG
jgi:glutathione peroxidase